ncbi:MAG: NADH-quinone oxidoreductase subunit C [Holosporales bacterium]
MTKELESYAKSLQKTFKKDCAGYEVVLGEVTLLIERAAILKVLSYLRDHQDHYYRQLIDLCAVDYPDRNPRFEVVYHLLSLKHNKRLRLKVLTDASTPVPSCVDLFSSANWWEREAFDLMGILFEGHPDLRRILTDYGFEGHPLRKDFPLTGYVEVRYDDQQKRVAYDAVQLPQAFRTFDNLSPWEGMTPHLPGDEKASQGGA